MHKLSTAAALCVSLCACAQQPNATNTVPTSSPEALVRVTEGGDLAEIERTAEASIIEVRSAPTGSVPSSMFALRGACAVARARGEKFFSSVPIQGAIPTHRLTFPKNATESQLKGREKSVFSLKECEMLRF